MTAGFVASHQNEAIILLCQIYVFDLLQVPDGEFRPSGNTVASSGNSRLIKRHPLFRSGRDETLIDTATHVGGSCDFTKRTEINSAIARPSYHVASNHQLK